MFFISHIKNSQGFLSFPSLFDIAFIRVILYTFSEQLENTIIYIPVVCASNVLYTYT